MSRSMNALKIGNEYNNKTICSNRIECGREVPRIGLRKQQAWLRNEMHCGG